LFRSVYDVEVKKNGSEVVCRSKPKGCGVLAEREGFELEPLQKAGYSASKMMLFDFQNTKFL
ncbi:hypothetical protein, partial [Flavonifractor sp.]|uniref:hypothetical protein n=1 Tax=Flavonifractor sp. TaxID=2049025 RepID=UPI00307C9A39